MTNISSRKITKVCATTLKKFNVISYKVVTDLAAFTRLQLRNFAFKSHFNYSKANSN